jgi:hypothetical protein
MIAGKPLVNVSAVEAPTQPQRFGFLKDEIEVPANFDRMGARDRSVVRRRLRPITLLTADAQLARYRGSF